MLYRQFLKLAVLVISFSLSHVENSNATLTHEAGPSSSSASNSLQPLTEQELNFLEEALPWDERLAIEKLLKRSPELALHRQRQHLARLEGERKVAARAAAEREKVLIEERQALCTKKSNKFSKLQKKALKPLISADKKLVNNILENIALAVESKSLYSPLSVSLANELIEIHASVTIGDSQRVQKLLALREQTIQLLSDIKNNIAPAVNPDEMKALFEAELAKQPNSSQSLRSLFLSGSTLFDRSYEIRASGGFMVGAMIGLKAGVAKNAFGNRKLVCGLSTGASTFNTGAEISLFKNNKILSRVDVISNINDLNHKSGLTSSMAFGLGSTSYVDHPLALPVKLNGISLGLGQTIPVFQCEMGAPRLALKRDFAALRDSFGIRYSVEQLTPALYDQLGSNIIALHQELLSSSENVNESESETSQSLLIKDETIEMTEVYKPTGIIFHNVGTEAPPAYFERVSIVEASLIPSASELATHSNEGSSRNTEEMIAEVNSLPSAPSTELRGTSQRSRQPLIQQLAE